MRGGMVWGNGVMHFYIRLQLIGAISVECRRDFGYTPMYSFGKWHNESIIHLPWTEIILTPRSSIIDEKECVAAKPLDGGVVYNCVFKPAPQAPEDRL